MNIEDLRRSWNTLDNRVDELEESTRELERRITANRITTSRDKLKTIARNLAIACFAAIMTSFPLWKMSSTMVLILCVFFLVMGGIQVHTYLMTDAVNLSRMTVAEALKSVYDLEKMRWRKRAFGMITGIPLLLYMLYFFHSIDEPVIFYGGCTGVAVGATIGLIINHRNVELLKEMRRELEDI